MRFTKVNKFVYVCIATFGTIAIVFIVNSLDANNTSITENNVRSQLEQMYDAEVAEVKKNEDVYEAIIAKSGEVYLVEMNAATGDVNSLEHTDEFIIKEVPIVAKEAANEEVGKSPEVGQKTPTTLDKGKSKIISSNGTSKLVISEKPKKSSEKIKVVENPKDTEKKAKKEPSTKKEEKAEEKPIKKVIKNVIKDALNKEENKTETASKEKKKVEEEKETEKVKEKEKEVTAKAEVSKAAIESDPVKVEPETIEALKLQPAKAEASKTETAAEVPKSEESQSSKETISIKSEEMSEDVEKNATVLITAEEAIKLAQAQQKGVVESNTFIRTNEGGYYLIVMGVESSKEKKSKATVQVHAISGKILSITWE